MFKPDQDAPGTGFGKLSASSRNVTIIASLFAMAVFFVATLILFMQSLPTAERVSLTFPEGTRQVSRILPDPSGIGGGSRTGFALSEAG